MAVYWSGDASWTSCLKIHRRVIATPAAEIALCAHMCRTCRSNRSQDCSFRCSQCSGAIRVQAAAWDMANCIDRNTLTTLPEYCEREPSLESVQKTLALAHRLSYTSFAPPGCALTSAWHNESIGAIAGSLAVLREPTGAFATAITLSALLNYTIPENCRMLQA